VSLEFENDLLFVSIGADRDSRLNPTTRNCLAKVHNPGRVCDLESAGDMVLMSCHLLTRRTIATALCGSCYAAAAGARHEGSTSESLVDELGQFLVHELPLLLERSSDTPCS
jgi:hypothetical protein